jgi:hypothetical protein
MKRATWIVAVVCVILLVDLVLFGLYIPPLVWHAGHGNYVEMKGIRYRLPLIYLEHSTVGDELYISTTLYPFPLKTAEITLRPRKAYAIPETDDFMRGLGLQRSLSRRVNVAGREGTCVEYAPSATTTTTYIVLCTLAEDLNAEFMGTENAIPDFYAILQSGEAVKGKH